MCENVTRLSSAAKLSVNELDDVNHRNRSRNRQSQICLFAFNFFAARVEFMQILLPSGVVCSVKDVCEGAVHKINHTRFVRIKKTRFLSIVIRILSSVTLKVLKSLKLSFYDSRSIKFCLSFSLKPDSIYRRCLKLL